ncbi:MAG: hypothetical protein KIS92_01015 [Planctomycetota bacterium]|nr:hypothetical protein [Planctomycetota bacterium]
MKHRFRAPLKQRRPVTRHVWQVCARKKPFKSARHATRFAERRGFHGQRAYRCPVCGKYHLTKQKEHVA